MSDFATELERLLIEEVSGVDAPANNMPGWQIMKAASAPVRKAPARKAAVPPWEDPPKGMTVLKLEGGSMDGFIAVADSWLQKLEAEGGPEGVTAHFQETIKSMGGIPEEALATMQAAGLTKSAGRRDISSVPARSAEVSSGKARWFRGRFFGV